MDGFLFAVFVFLAAAVLVVPFAKLTGLGAVLGYLIAGILIGPEVLGLVTDAQTILHFAEFGVVMMLFLIGLELQPKELWGMRRKLVGLGFTQVLFTSAAITGIGLMLGLLWQSALVIGMALALSSTAIVLQILAERQMMNTESGRSAFSVLLFQDIAVIPILAIVPLLALPELLEQIANTGLDGHGATNDHGASDKAPLPGWLTTLRVAGVFVGMFVVGRYGLRYVFRAIASTGVRELFTALALFLVVGAALLMAWIDLSAALGAFMVGMILADSEYRHELETDIEPFKGLLLGLFFISVGVGIDFDVFADAPFTIAMLVIGLIALKAAILFGIGSMFRMIVADKLWFATLLAQGGEFAFVVFQFALVEGALPTDLSKTLNLVVGLSMVATPFLVLTVAWVLQKKAQNTGSLRPHDTIEERKSVILLGFGRFGQIIMRILSAQGYEITLVDHDPIHIETMKKYDVKVYYGDASRPDLLNAAGAAEADLLVIAISNAEKILAIAEHAKKHHPNLKILARALDRPHAQDLIELGVDGYERQSFHSAVAMGAKALHLMGIRKHRAQRLAQAFARYDQQMLEETVHIRKDEKAYMDYIKRNRDLINSTLHQDEQVLDKDDADKWNARFNAEESDARADEAAQ